MELRDRSCTLTLKPMVELNFTHHVHTLFAMNMPLDKAQIEKESREHSDACSSMA